jgi:hypothetical protein
MDIVSLLTSLCCGCWIVPLAGFGLLYGIGHSIGHALYARGIKQDGMYCAGCKFDVRGATGERCPECGAYLLEPASSLAPRGGIVVHGLNPPMSLGLRELIYLVAGFAPIVAGVVVLGLLLPINYQHTTRVYLTPNNHAGNDYLRFSVDSQRSWLGSKQFEELNCWQANSGTVEAFNEADQPNEAQAQKIWRDIMASFPDLIPAQQRTDMCDEFVAVLLAACAFDQTQARRELNGFQMEWESETEPVFHWLYTVFCFIAVIAGVVLLVLRALKDHDVAIKAYLEIVDGIQQRYRQMLEGNQPPR